jgi:hypothetical protein
MFTVLYMACILPHINCIFGYIYNLIYFNSNVFKVTYSVFMVYFNVFESILSYLNVFEIKHLSISKCITVYFNVLTNIVNGNPPSHF